jgi:high-affinity Fe2+/Pb2+ permease
MTVLSILAQASSSDNGAGVAVAVVLLVLLALVWVGLLVLTLAGYWTVFTKIGLPGWMGIVPFVNVYMIFKARGQHDPVVYLILCMIPCVNLVGLWFLASDTAELFDKEIGWTFFLFFLPGVSHLVLGLGDHQVQPANVAPGVGVNELRA